VRGCFSDDLLRVISYRAGKTDFPIQTQEQDANELVPPLHVGVVRRECPVRIVYRIYSLYYTTYTSNLKSNAACGNMLLLILETCAQCAVCSIYIRTRFR